MSARPWAPVFAQTEEIVADELCHNTLQVLVYGYVTGSVHGDGPFFVFYFLT